MNLKKKIWMVMSLAVLLLASCNRDRSHPGWDYFPDMFYSNAYETYSENPNFEDGMTMRKPVQGTVSRDFPTFRYTIDEPDRKRAGAELVNPVIADNKALERGEEVYRVFCAGCHGNSGKGDGILYSSGKYPVLPRSLVNENARGLKDGEIYHSITLGFGSMGAHGALVKPDDRWKVVRYIRMVLQKQD